jgi:hypothetical protein
MKDNGLIKQTVAEAMIEKIKEDDSLISIETQYVDEYQKPDKISWKNTGIGYTPDIRVVLKNGKKSLYEIELADEFDTDKWELFSLFARKNNGDLYLIVPEWMLDRVKDELHRKKINKVNLIYFNDERNN